jgi:UDP-N-acetylmuramoylalanine--D-glutamate ligase
VDVVGLSPGLSVHEPLVQAALARGIPVRGEIELFARRLAGRAPVVAITGTNGKSTVTAMLGAMAQACGKRAAVAGNISPAALAALLDAEDAGRLPELWVLELSSFQLETTESLKPRAAAVLNVTEDHFDRHAGIDEYVATKARVFDGEDCVQVLNRQDARVMAMARPGRRVVSFGTDAPRSEDDFGIRLLAGAPWLARGEHNLIPCAQLLLAGEHNLANALSALALGAIIGLPMQIMLATLRTFRGLPHRVEYVASFLEVDFYDDSKGTNAGATVAAIDGLRRKLVLIAGGDGKGQDFSTLREPISQWARAVVLIGTDARRLERTLSGHGVPLVHASDMETAVSLAWQHAKPGDAVLLSPACASLDMFQSYKHRGEVFVRAVHAFIARGGKP